MLPLILTAMSCVDKSWAATACAVPVGGQTIIDVNATHPLVFDGCKWGNVGLLIRCDVDSVVTLRDIDMRGSYIGFINAPGLPMERVTIVVQRSRIFANQSYGALTLRPATSIRQVTMIIEDSTIVSSIGSAACMTTITQVDRSKASVESLSIAVINSYISSVTDNSVAAQSGNACSVGIGTAVAEARNVTLAVVDSTVIGRTSGSLRGACAVGIIQPDRTNLDPATTLMSGITIAVARSNLSASGVSSASTSAGLGLHSTTRFEISALSITVHASNANASSPYASAVAGIGYHGDSSPLTTLRLTSTTFIVTSSVLVATGTSSIAIGGVSGYCTANTMDLRLRYTSMTLVASTVRATRLGGAIALLGVAGQKYTECIDAVITVSDSSLSGMYSPSTSDNSGGTSIASVVGTTNQQAAIAIQRVAVIIVDSHLNANGGTGLAVAGATIVSTVNGPSGSYATITATQNTVVLLRSTVVASGIAITSCMGLIAQTTKSVATIRATSSVVVAVNSSLMANSITAYSAVAAGIFASYGADVSASNMTFYVDSSTVNASAPLASAVALSVVANGYISTTGNKMEVASIKLIAVASHIVATSTKAALAASVSLMLNAPSSGVWASIDDQATMFVLCGSTAVTKGGSSSVADKEFYRSMVLGMDATDGGAYRKMHQIALLSSITSTCGFPALTVCGVALTIPFISSAIRRTATIISSSVLAPLSRSLAMPFITDSTFGFSSDPNRKPAMPTFNGNSTDGPYLNVTSNETCRATFMPNNIVSLLASIDVPVVNPSDLPITSAPPRSKTTTIPTTTSDAPSTFVTTTVSAASPGTSTIDSRTQSETLVSSSTTATAVSPPTPTTTGSSSVMPSTTTTSPPPSPTATGSPQTQRAQTRSVTRPRITPPPPPLPPTPLPRSDVAVAGERSVVVATAATTSVALGVDSSALDAAVDLQLLQLALHRPGCYGTPRRDVNVDDDDSGGTILRPFSVGKGPAKWILGLLTVVTGIAVMHAVVSWVQRDKTSPNMSSTLQQVMAGNGRWPAGTIAALSIVSVGFVASFTELASSSSSSRPPEWAMFVALVGAFAPLVMQFMVWRATQTEGCSSPAQFELYADRELAAAVPKVVPAALTWMLPKGRWGPPATRRAFGVAFAAYNPRRTFFCMANTLRGLGIGVGASLLPPSNEADAQSFCKSQSFILAAVCGVYAIVILIIAPRRVPGQVPAHALTNLLAGVAFASLELGATPEQLGFIVLSASIVTYLGLVIHLWMLIAEKRMAKARRAYSAQQQPTQQDGTAGITEIDAPLLEMPSKPSIGHRSDRPTSNPLQRS